MRRLVRGDRARSAAARPRAASAKHAPAAGSVGARAGAAAGGLGGGARAHGVPAAQILLTAVDVADRGATSTCGTRSTRCLPRRRPDRERERRDRDRRDLLRRQRRARAHMALLVRARLLVLLTEVEGVYCEHPATPGANLIADGEAVGDAPLGRATGPGRGGMASKIAAGARRRRRDPDVIAARPRRRRARPDPRGRASRHPLQGRRRAPRPSASGFASRSRRRPDPRRRRARARRSSRTAQPARGRDRPLRGRFVAGDGVELVGPDGAPSRRESRARARAELRGKARGLEAVHRDRLVVYWRRLVVRPSVDPAFRELEGARHGDPGRIARERVVVARFHRDFRSQPRAVVHVRGEVQGVGVDRDAV